MHAPPGVERGGQGARVSEADPCTHLLHLPARYLPAPTLRGAPTHLLSPTLNAKLYLRLTFAHALTAGARVAGGHPRQLPASHVEH